MQDDTFPLRQKIRFMQNEQKTADFGDFGQFWVILAVFAYFWAVLGVFGRFWGVFGL